MSPEETTEIPTKLLVRHIVEEAIEYGELEHKVTVDDNDVVWHPANVSNWGVSIRDDVIVLEGITTGSYSVQTARAKLNPPGDAHPAEYAQRTVEVSVTIRADWSEHPLGEYTIAAMVA